MIPSMHYVILASILFSIGLLGILIRRSLILILLSVELMLNAANLVFIAGSQVHAHADGQLTAFFVMVIAAAEVTIGLAVTILLFRQKDSVDTEEICEMKG